MNDLSPAPKPWLGLQKVINKIKRKLILSKQFFLLTPQRYNHSIDQCQRDQAKFSLLTRSGLYALPENNEAHFVLQKR